MGGPVDTEREFQSLLELLSEPAATAHRMIRAAQFIETFRAGDHSVDSYVIELADALPSPDTPPGYYGSDPETLHQALRAVTSIRSRIPGLPHADSVQEKLHSFGRNVALAYVHVGQLREACAVLGAGDVPSWLSVYSTAPVGTSRQRLAAAALGAKTRREKVTEQLMLLEQSYPRPLRGSSVYLPVLERSTDQGGRSTRSPSQCLTLFAETLRWRSGRNQYKHPDLRNCANPRRSAGASAQSRPFRCLRAEHLHAKLADQWAGPLRSRGCAPSGILLRSGICRPLPLRPRGACRRQGNSGAGGRCCHDRDRR
jgi:hypothetical protein